MSMKNVAKLAGVSVATVSRVASGHPRISARTAENVRQAMKIVGYTPPRRRRHRRSRRHPGVRTGVLGLLFPNSEPGALQTPLSRRLRRGLDIYAHENGLKIQVAHLDSAGRITPELDQSQVDGVLIRAGMGTTWVAEQISHMPITWIFRTESRQLGDVVMPDNELVAQQAFDYLLYRGHERVCCLNVRRSHCPSDMRAYYFEGLARQQNAVAKTLDSPLNGMPEDVPELIDQVLAQTPRVSGIFMTLGDDYLSAAYQHLQRRGVRPGRDIDLVACCNNLEIINELSPSPAAVDIRPEHVAQAAIDMMLWRLANLNQPQRQITVAPRLIMPDEFQVIDAASVDFRTEQGQEAASPMPNRV